MTDIPAARPGSTWTERTTFVPPPAWLARRAEGGARLWRLLLSAAWGLRLLRARGRFACAVTVGAGEGLVFAILQALLPTRRLPHVMIDCLWYREPTPWRRLFARAKFTLLRRAVSTFVVWASAEVQDYAREFCLPPEKLVFLPFHHTLFGYDVSVSDDGFVFAGGDGDRDYATLVAAARRLSASVLIATRLPQWHRAAPELAPGVQVRALTPSEFRQAMARARIVVVPLAPGLLHAGGQQTYLNAMALGKPVVVADARGAPDYVTDGVTGLIVPAGDARALAEALERLLSDGALRAALGGRAAAEVTRRDLSTEGCMRRIVTLCEGLLSGQSPQAAAASVSAPAPRLLADD